MKKFLRLSTLLGIVVLGGLLLLLSVSGQAAAPAQKIYWTDRENGRVWRANLDGSMVELIWDEEEVDRHETLPTGVDTDMAQQQIYWIASGVDSFRDVMRANLDGSDAVPIVGGGYMTSLAVDPASGFVYWSSAGPMDIRRAKLDGSDETIVIAGGHFQPEGMALDALRMKLYWSARTGDVSYSNLDGTEVKSLPIPIPVIGLAVDSVAEKLYWTGGNSHNGYRIGRSNLDGSAAEIVLAVGDNRPQGIALDLDERKMYWAESGSSGFIRRANLDGSDAETVVSGLQAPHGVVVDRDAGYLYWADWSARKIQRARLSGSEVVDLVHTGDVLPRHLVVHTVAGRFGQLYWTGDGVGQVWTAQLEGGSPSVLIPGPAGSSRGLVLDEGDNKLIWMDLTTRSTWRADRDGGRVEPIIWPRVFDPQGLSLDLVGGKMYWADVETDMIMRSGLDGLNLEPVIDAGLESPTSLVLDVIAGKLYWADWETKEIGRANLDGSGVEILLTAADGLVRPNHVALDLATQMLYWTDFGTGTIHRANLDGTAVELVFDDLGVLGGLALDQATPGTYRFLLALIE